MKRLNWFDISLVLVVMTISAYASFSDAQNLSNRWFIRDDAYYYFKVAQNISEGRGSTFDGINPTNGYHPLWLWICVPVFALARFDLILPLRILLLLSSGLTAATAILLYRLIGRVFPPAIGAAAALYWVFSREILSNVYQQGLETGIAAFFIVLFICKLFEFERSWRTQPVSGRQLAALGLFAVPVLFSRLDLVFLAAVAGLWIVFRKQPLRYLLPLDIVFIVASALLAIMLRVTFKDYYKFSDVAVAMTALGLILKIPAAYFFGLYQHSVMANFGSFFKRLTLFALSTSTLIGTAMIVATPLAGFEGFPRTAIVYDLLLTFALFGLLRLGMRGLWSEIPPADEPSPLRLFIAHWKTWLGEGIAYYGVVFGALGAYMLYNKLVFGTFSPVSGQIKRWWGSLSGNVYGGAAPNPLAFFGITYKEQGNAWHPASTLFGQWAEAIPVNRILDDQRYLILLALFALVFYLLLHLNKHKARTAIVQLGIIPLFSAAWLQVIYYHITGYSAYKEWYWISQYIIVTISICLMAGMAYQTMRKIQLAGIALWLVPIALGLAMGIPYWNYVREAMPYGKAQADDPYNEIAAFLQQHTEPGSIIGMTGGGNAGYFLTDRTVINMDGLINSYEYFNLLKQGEAGEYLAELGMDYVLANYDLIDQLPYNGQYNPYIEWTDIRFGGKDLMRYHPIPQP